jgi:hypothetical protein
MNRYQYRVEKYSAERAYKNSIYNEQQRAYRVEYSYFQLVMKHERNDDRY